MCPFFMLQLFDYKGGWQYLSKKFLNFEYCKYMLMLTKVIGKFNLKIYWISCE